MLALIYGLCAIASFVMSMWMMSHRKDAFGGHKPPAPLYQRVAGSFLVGLLWPVALLVYCGNCAFEALYE